MKNKLPVTRCQMPALVLGLTLAFTIPAFAEENNTEEFERIQEEIKRVKEESEELQAKSEEIGTELKDLKESSVKIAAKLESTESSIDKIQSELEELSKQTEEKSQELEKRRKELSASIAAMVRLSSRPPETVIAMPGEAKDTLIASKALGGVVKALRDKSEEIKLSLAEIETLSTKIEEKKTELVSVKDSLEKSRKELESKVAERQALERQTISDLKKKQLALEELSKKSESFKELISRIEDARKSEPVSEKPLFSSNVRSDSGSGKMRLPVAGKVTSRFGDQLEKNSTSKGLRIKTRDSANVITPAEGEVVFTGPFMKYGKILIIRHDDGYHSLLSGFKKVDVLPGQKLAVGEPVGVMGKEKDNANVLYVEFRKDNKPVDPESLLAQQVGKASNE